MPERDAFAKMVLFDMRPLAAFTNLALKIHARLEARVEGRMWMGAHMRRGDCKCFLIASTCMSNGFVVSAASFHTSILTPVLSPPHGLDFGMEPRATLQSP